MCKTVFTVVLRAFDNIFQCIYNNCTSLFLYNSHVPKLIVSAYHLLSLFIRKEACISTVNKAKDLVKLLLSGLNMAQINIIKLSISVLLYAASKVETLLAQNMMEKVFEICEIALQDWVGRVIGGNYFGYKVQNKMRMLYGSTELKVSFTFCIFEAY